MIRAEWIEGNVDVLFDSFGLEMHPDRAFRMKASIRAALLMAAVEGRKEGLLEAEKLVLALGDGPIWKYAAEAIRKVKETR